MLPVLTVSNSVFIKESSNVYILLQHRVLVRPWPNFNFLIATKLQQHAASQTNPDEIPSQPRVNLGEGMLLQFSRDS